MTLDAIIEELQAKAKSVAGRNDGDYLQGFNDGMVALVAALRSGALGRDDA